MAAAPTQTMQMAAQVAQQAVPNQPPPALPLQPASANIGGNQSITPGQIVFTEYQARVFNQTEAMYKTTGYLGISLFEDSYGLSKRTASYVVSSIPLSGTVGALNGFATQTYRAVLGIAAPVAPPPPPPDPIIIDGGNTPTGPVVVPPTKGDTVSVSTTPTTFTDPTQVATIADVGPNANNIPTSINNITPTPNFPPNFNPGTGPGTGTMSGIGGLGLTGGGGSKIICNELYRQGYLSEEMWNADEQYGEMMFEKDPKLVIGYQMWARKVVKYMKKNPNNTKMAYWLFKPWTEYMGYKMGVVEKPTLKGRFTNWIGTQFSYMVFDLYNGKRLLDKYNYKLFKSENNISTYKMA
jgi:hypothetical protein